MRGLQARAALHGAAGRLRPRPGDGAGDGCQGDAGAGDSVDDIQRELLILPAVLGIPSVWMGVIEEARPERTLRDHDRNLSQVLTLRAKRAAPSLPEEEARLLQKINQGLPPDVQQRYDELTAKRRAETLTPEERQELLALVNRIEQADAERVQALAELARLRNVTVTTLMAQPGIRRPAYA